ncbi:tubulin tyrosine ligase [Angomonas deanei]|uniref:Tubulin-tyrosine ligase family, putative n=1 Tax=Angomonas deanei TaxID=59799 RepID=A0A7G2BYL9_9TRYP|nr:tubulin tyrosine ligase [Angomonas deanei]CAD2212679.1 Tubulin-tyrosine ligase family, putative [Angomonas deanei]|eukprot:EPY40491.1 tubulin tyrosine ligase [Angomonas deanei]
MSMFIEEFKRRPGTSWIVKPTSRSQGKGIFIINRIQQLTRWMKDKKDAERENTQNTILSHPGLTGSSSPLPSASTSKEIQNMLGSFIVSKYIAKPLLIGQRKFDLRLYVLVTSFKPLVAYLHREGFARFCATRYEGDNFSDDSLGSHLTNVALQKGDEHYNSTHGGKWSFRNVLLYIQGRYGAYVAEGLATSIEFLIYHSLKAMDTVMFNDKHSFELYGYDILIDEDVKPHLIEVNASPSLSVTTTSDRLMKEEVLSDTVKIVFPPGFPNNKTTPYWEHRLKTDWATRQKTGFKLLQF